MNHTSRILRPGVSSLHFNYLFLTWNSLHVSPTEESQVGSATKIFFPCPPSLYHSIGRMTGPWLGSGESNLKSGLGTSLPSEPCKQGICQPHSVAPWHIYGFSDGSHHHSCSSSPVPPPSARKLPNQIFWLAVTDESTLCPLVILLPSCPSFQEYWGATDVSFQQSSCSCAMSLSIFQRSYSFIPSLTLQTQPRVSKGLVILLVIEIAASQAYCRVHDFKNSLFSLLPHG